MDGLGGDVPVFEVADADVSVRARGRVYLRDVAAFDGEDTVRAISRMAAFRLLVVDVDVDAEVVVLPPGVEERPADRVLVPYGRHRPTVPIVRIGPGMALESTRDRAGRRRHRVRHYGQDDGKDGGVQPQAS